jgi:hypothetical protein
MFFVTDAHLRQDMNNMMYQIFWTPKTAYVRTQPLDIVSLP